MMKVKFQTTLRIEAAREIAYSNGAGESFDCDLFAKTISKWDASSHQGIDAVDTDGRLVGWVSYSLIDAEQTVGFLDYLWCQSDMRCVGVGRTLLDRATENLHQLGAREVGLWVGVDNQKAQSLYKKAGWTTNYLIGRGYYRFARNFDEPRVR